MDRKRSVGKPPPEKQCEGTSKRTGMRCENWKAKGKDVCHIHGGKTPRGIGSPHFKTGRYSKSVPARLSSSYEEALADARRVELNDELALIIGRNQELLNGLYSGESDGLWVELRKAKRAYEKEVRAAHQAEGHGDGVRELRHRAEANARLGRMMRLIEQGASDAERWGELMRNVEGQRRLSESERKRRVEEQQVVTTEEIMALMGAILAVITRHVKDERVRRAIGADLDGLVAGTAPGALSAN